MKGHVYILTNKSMPGIVKIGMTTRTPEQRAAELYQTGVPCAFEVYDSVYTPDCAQLEQWCHEAFGDRRLSSEREFFKVPASEAFDEVQTLHRELVTSWLEAFLPGEIPAPVEMALNEASVFELAHAADATSYEIAGALSEVTADEVAAPLGRYREAYARRIARRKEASNE